MNRHRHSPELPTLIAAAADAYRRRDDDSFRDRLTRAIAAAPWRLDLRLNLANHHVQCGDIQGALGIWRTMLDLSRRDVDAMTYMAHWTRYLGSGERAEYIRQRLAAALPERADDLARIWEYVDAWEGQPIAVAEALGHQPPRDATILVLGYQLNPDGTMHEQLIDRLETGLELHHTLPDSRLLVSGGVPRGGRVEAEAMRGWYEERGVAPELVREEGSSRDVVENMIYSRQILDQDNVADVVIITAAHNVRRAGAALEIVGWRHGSAWRVECLASTRSHAAYADAGADRHKLYRDALRAYGLPMMATYPDLIVL